MQDVPKPLPANEIQRLRAQLEQAIKNEARKRKVNPQLIRKQFSFSLLFERIFSEAPANEWVLLGGNALFIREGSGRFTRDVDIAFSPASSTLKDVHQRLTELTSPRREDRPSHSKYP